MHAFHTIWPSYLLAFMQPYPLKRMQFFFPKMRGGGSKAVRHFSKNSSDLVARPFFKTKDILPISHLIISRLAKKQNTGRAKAPPVCKKEIFLLHKFHFCYLSLITLLLYFNYRRNNLPSFYVTLCLSWQTMLLISKFYQQISLLFVYSDIWLFCSESIDANCFNGNILETCMKENISAQFRRII